MTTWYGGLTPRERLLVSIAGTLAALLFLIYGIVLPLGRAHDAAHVRHRAAVESSGRLLSQLAALEAPAPARAQLAGPIAQVVTTSADTAGFVLQSNQPRGDDRTVISIPTARPSAALAWIDRLAEQGIVLDNLTMTPAADGSVALNATLRRVGGAAGAQ
ncbi:type II secretion system protein GspM [Novosphingobium tardum]|uniref:Type II secretion system protein GspM n=1 Tax=Novosphingobium tardum TaxID=1538021 RepID=A0ABV8RPZ8_9SPHN